MKRATKKNNSIWTPGRLGLFLLLAFACFAPQNRIWAFSVMPETGVGLSSLESPMFIGENVDEFRYDVSGYTVAPIKVPGRVQSRINLANDGMGKRVSTSYILRKKR